MNPVGGYEPCAGYKRTAIKRPNNFIPHSVKRQERGEEKGEAEPRVYERDRASRSAQQAFVRCKIRARSEIVKRDNLRAERMHRIGRLSVGFF